jgi:hypothetical protein
MTVVPRIFCKMIMFAVVGPVGNARALSRRQVGWDQAAMRRVSFWPDAVLTIPCYQNTYGLPWTAFPASLEAAVDARFADPVEDGDFFADNGRMKPWRRARSRPRRITCAVSPRGDRGDGGVGQQKRRPRCEDGGFGQGGCGGLQPPTVRLAANPDMSSAV